MSVQGKGQAWSVDLVVGVLIFLLVIGLFYSLLTRSINDDTTQIKIESETIANKLTDEESVNSLITNGEIDTNKLDNFHTLSEIDLEQIKADLGVENDFCIFFEDDAGNIVPIVLDDGSGGKEVYYSIGSKNINVSGYECGDRISP